MSFILNIDSSLQNASVSIARDGQIIKYLSNPVQKDHAAFLHVAIKELMKNGNFLWEECDAIASTIGPGSYTGMRVGLAAAKGLSYALNKPLITIGTLEAMAQTAQQEHEEKENYYYCPMIDARRMEVYTSLYDPHLKEFIPPHALVLQPDSFDFHLQQKKIFFFGNGMEKWKNISNHKNAFFTEIGEIFPAIGILSFNKVKEKDFADISMSVPLYSKDFFTGS